MMAQLQNGSLDVSLFPIVTASFPSQARMPVEVLFTMAEQEKVFLSPPVTNATTARLHILSTFMSLDNLLLSLCLVLSVVLVIMMFLSSRGPRRRRHTHWLNYTAVLFRTPASVGLSTRRDSGKLTLITTSLLVACFFQVYTSSTKTDLVLEKPEQFLQTLKDLLTTDKLLVAIENHVNVVLFSVHSSNALIKQIANRVHFVKGTGMKMYTKLATLLMTGDKVAFFNRKYDAMVVQGVTCVLRRINMATIYLKSSASFGKSDMNVIVSRKTSDRLKSKLKSVYSHFMQSGVYQNVLTPTKLMRSMEQATRGWRMEFRECMREMLGKRSQKDSLVRVLTITYFGMTFRVLGTLWLLAVMTFIAERLRRRQRPAQRKPVKRYREGRLVTMDFNRLSTLSLSLR